MDATDLRILQILQRDARATQQEIARRVRLSQPSVADRIHKLEARGVIVTYIAKLDPGQLGKDITAFIGVGISHPKYFEQFGKKILALPDVLECHRVAGADSYLLKIRTENTRSLDRLLVEQIRSIPGVYRTETTLVLSSIKEDLALSINVEQEASP
ncbi:MAG TPA: Lrp/AsnC family transcriptional regulator [Kofleriaceae bacterium]|nr:Lrp/AsnC family transcriptional regulator [Kofleriaceae bacterium]